MSSDEKNARAARRERHAAIRAEVADEELEAAEAEAAEKAAILDVPLHLRISHGLDAELRRRATAEHIPTSALVRRILTRALRDPASDRGPLTEEQVEQIARRVMREAA